MSAPESEYPLPPYLEREVAALFRGDADPEDVQAELDRLVEAHPDHTAALRARFDRLGTEDPETQTVDLGTPAIDWAEPPQFIGPYRVLATLGTGGMGVVYLAEQTEPVRRDVAIKLIKLGMNSREVLDRFDVERQALAMMNHPGIAKVFDAGVSDDGQPYFVMEYARGVPLSEFCDEHELTVTGRIHIFQQVCMAVQHAHQKGVLHRDLKPANILCTREGPQPVIKIIDFGLARATDQGSVARTLYTEQGKIIGTPEYMSPEQARGDAAAIDTRTDVYSLGVILYQLLSGVKPFRSIELRSVGLLELYRLIQEGDPGRPSSRVSTTDLGTRARARHRRMSPASLRKTLQGDLDWIVMKAMAKEPDRRYDSATALAMDLRRYLRHEPVEAGPPGAGYRFERFVRRYRVQLLATAVVFAITVACIVLVWSYARDAYEQLEMRADAESRAESKAAEAARQGELARDAARAAGAKELDLRRARQEFAKVAARVAALDAELHAARQRIAALQSESNLNAAAARRWEEEASGLTFQKRVADEELRAAREQLLRREELVLAAELRALEAGFATLGSGPTAVVPMRAWLRRAEALVLQLPRVRGHCEPPAEVATATDRERRARLQQLVADLVRFDGPDGLRAKVRRELAWAGAVTALTTGGAAAGAWALARRAIAAADGVAASSRYAEARFDLKPQPGLLPLGIHPETGLWEFYHPRSALAVGAEPADVAVPPLASPGRRYTGVLSASAFPGMVFVLIPGHTVPLGDNESVRLDPFFLCKHELTQRQWLDLDGAPSRSGLQPGSRVAGRTITGRHPVESVDWRQATAFLARFGLALPTDAQWEYACRGGVVGRDPRDLRDAEEFLKHDRKPAANILDRAAKSVFPGRAARFYDGFVHHAPVGRFAANGFGLHDMLGNVEEWCRDAFAEEAGRLLPGTGERQVRGTPARRVVRGGSFRDEPVWALPGARRGAVATNRSRARGLRASRAVR